MRDSSKVEIAKNAFASYYRKHGGFMHQMERNINDSLIEKFNMQPKTTCTAIPKLKINLITKESFSTEMNKSQEFPSSKRKKVN